MVLPSILLVLFSNPGVFEQRSLALEAHLGLGTPLGFGGLALDYAPLDWLSLNLGAGLGHAGFPPQVALTLRGRPIGGFGIGVHVSGGPYRWIEGGIFQAAVDGGAEKEWSFAIWSGADLSYEFRARSGFMIRKYSGMTFLLNNGAGECTVAIPHCNAEHRQDGRILFYTGFAIGYAFEL